MKKLDVIIIGAGHNGLVAACYAAKAGKSVLVIEGQSEIGGATSSVKAFPGFDARISRYSYLVSLLPDQIIQELGLRFRTLSRSVSSYTPYSRGDISDGLFVGRNWDDHTEQSFLTLTGDHREGKSWQKFYADIAQFAARIAPTLLEPLKTRDELRDHIDLASTWQMLMERPIGESIMEEFKNDLVRGVVLTDALVGTYASAFSLQANRCFLYHLMGNATGEWRVPQGGMGTLVSELERVAKQNGVEILTGIPVSAVASDSASVSVTLVNGIEYTADYLLSNAAPQVLAKLRGGKVKKSLDGSQIKINLLLKKLPELKSKIDAKKAFVGTFHVNESFSQLEEAFTQSSQGLLPSASPTEMYCHTLTDPSILSPELQVKGFHTLTLFGFHTPAALFDKNPEAIKEAAVDGALKALNSYLVEPIQSCIAQTPDGALSMEAKSPLDLEADLSLPRGNIFHQDLVFPFRENGTAPGWGVETDDPRIFLCGAGAIRGGGVSGIAGRSAAMALLESC